MLDLAAEVRPGLDDLSEVISDAAQVVHDPRTVADEVAQDLDVGQTHDPAVDPVVEAVQAVDLVGPDGEVEQARDGHHDDETDEQRAEVQHQGHDQGVAVERPAGEGTGPLSHQLAQPRDRDQQQADTADPHRQVHQQQHQQLQDGVADPPQVAATSRKDRKEVVSQGLLPRVPCQRWPSGTVCPECSEEAWPSWVPSPIEVSMSMTVASLITAFFPMLIAPTWMNPAWAR